jgi:hypothetical protein
MTKISRILILSGFIFLFWGLNSAYDFFFKPPEHDRATSDSSRLVADVTVWPQREVEEMVNGKRYQFSNADRPTDPVAFAKRLLREAKPSQLNLGHTQVPVLVEVGVSHTVESGYVAVVDLIVAFVVCVIGFILRERGLSKPLVKRDSL